jgi:hypothetical protein
MTMPFVKEKTEVEPGYFEDYVRFVGTEAEFEEWRNEWKQKYAPCMEFGCVHELMSCGINVACGECSIHKTMITGQADYICDNISCADCYKNYECDKPEKRY